VNSVSQKLEKLNSYLQLYSPFWSEWTKYSCNGLTETDIYVIASIKKNNFQFSFVDNIAMYFKANAIERITEKLRLNYPEFQEWIILKFQFSLVSLALEHDFDGFFATEIEFLPIHPELKMCLEKFKFRSLNDLFKTHSDCSFRQKPYFDLILTFNNILKQRGINFKSHNKKISEMSLKSLSDLSFKDVHNKSIK
jgi:hypothetical protein